MFTLPGLRGKGIATALTAAVTATLFDSGFETVALNVRGDNDPARRAYGRLGFAVHDVHW